MIQVCLTLSEFLSEGLSIGDNLEVNLVEVDLADLGGRVRGPVGIILAARLDPLRAEFMVVVRKRELGLGLARAKVDRTLDHVVVEPGRL